MYALRYQAVCGSSWGNTESRFRNEAGGVGASKTSIGRLELDAIGVVGEDGIRNAEEGFEGLARDVLILFTRSARLRRF